ncbi:MAG TPA: hypothetical protein V6D28_05025 [Leptolyngbyaceae cyanobacterium]
MSSSQSKSGLRKTIWNALILQADFYENARNTPQTKRISLTIVCLAALSHAIGSGVILLINLATLPILILSLLIDCLSIMAGYYFWTFSISKIAEWLKRNDVTFQELLIPIGYAYSPQVLNFLTVIPLLGKQIELLLSVWSLLAVIVAVRQGLDIKTRWSTLICLVGWPLIQIAIGFIQAFEQYLVKLGN